MRAGWALPWEGHKAGQCSALLTQDSGAQGKALTKVPIADAAPDLRICAQPARGNAGLVTLQVHTHGPMRPQASIHILQVLLSSISLSSISRTQQMMHKRTNACAQTITWWWGLLLVSCAHTQLTCGEQGLLRIKLQVHDGG